MIHYLSADRLTDQSGQSMFEFIMMLPLMAIFFYVSLKVATAIQISIVNQKYARSHTLFLAFNSPHYPQRCTEFNDDGECGGFTSTLIERGYNQFVIGVSEKQLSGDSNDSQAIFSPTVRVARPNLKDVRESPTKRATVRIRTSVSLCTDTKFISNGDKFLPLNSGMISDTFNQSVEFCRSPLRL